MHRAQQKKQRRTSTLALAEFRLGADRKQGNGDEQQLQQDSLYLHSVWLRKRAKKKKD